MATPTLSDFLVVPINGTDLIAFYRGSNTSRPLYLRYSTFLDILSQSIGGGTSLLLKTNGVQNPVQTILNFVDGSGMTITDEGGGNIKFTSSGGASYITSTSDSADIELDVTAGDLSAVLTAIGTAGTFGDATHVPQITVDSKGRITGVTLVAISASGILLQTDGVTNTDQTKLNLVAGTNMTLTDDGLGNITFDATGGGGGVTSVTATAPITSSGGATPDISTSMNTNKIIGRYSVGTGVMQEVSVGAGLSISGNSLIATGSASGGSSISYYLNGGTAASVLTYYQMSKTAVIGTNVDFPLAGNGLITQWLTDVGDPNRIEIPAGNWNFEIFMSASSAGGTPAFYVELLKYNGAFTTIANSSAAPENITGGTSIDLYLTSLAIPYTTLLTTDRLALRVYIVNSVIGRTITMHTQDSHLCQVITNFAGGIVSINGVGANTQFLTTGTAGTDFNIDSISTPDTHIFNLPTASAVNRGALSTTDWSTFNGKQNLLTTTKSVKVIANNVELENDETAPLARKFYSTSGAAARGWRYIEKADLPVLIQGAAYPYVEREYISYTGASAIIKIPGSNVIFVAYTNTATVVAYNTVTGNILSTTAVAAASGLVYVALTGEVWAFGSAVSITRFTATTGVSLGATVVLLLTASCRGVYDDSLVTGNVYAYNGSTMNVINATTYVRTGVSLVSGTGSFELTLVTSGVQAGLLIGCVNTGVFGFNKATNTLAYAPNAMLYAFIKHVPSLNVFIGVSLGSNFISLLTAPTSTSLAITSSLGGLQTPYSFEFDEAEDRIFILNSAISTSPLRLHIMELSTFTFIKSIVLTANAFSSISWMDIDKANKAMYVVATPAGGSINKVIYA